MKTKSIIEYLEYFNGTTEEVTELTINRFNIIGDIEEVDLIDLLNFPNLESLTLINLILDDKELIVLANLNKLNTITLINCEIVSSTTYKEFLNLKDITIDNSNFEYYINDQELGRLCIKNMNINCQNIITNTLEIDKSNIDLKTINFSNVNNLIISKTQFENNKEFLFSNKLNTHLIIKDDIFDGVIAEYE